MNTDYKDETLLGVNRVKILKQVNIHYVVLI